jgi:gliding motility-associated-like protein
VRINKLIIFLLLYVFMCYPSAAQLCQGSLGDPIVNITFSSGSNPGLPLSAATTSYSYIGDDCPNDGFYTVRNSTSNCFSSSWHSLFRDHTGNPNGYFMLVNAAFDPSPFYVDTVRGLCSNTTFEFAAWIVNMLKPQACDGNGIQPNLTFTIAKLDGTILQTYNTGFISSNASGQWNQYGFFFTTPPGVADVELRIFNNSRGGCGNDLALDDITFRPCGPLIVSSIDGFTSDNIFYCEQTARSFTLRANLSSGFSNPAYQWQQSNDGINWTDIDGANGTTYIANIAATAEGSFSYRLAAGESANFSSVKCRVVSPAIIITKGSKPVTTMNITSPACEGAPLTFTATGGTAYTWYREGGGLGVTQAEFTIPVADLNLAGKIYVRVEGSSGCFNIDSSILVILPKPNAVILPDSATICKGTSLQLNASGGISYVWEPAEGLSNNTIANPLASPLIYTNYIVTVTDANSCPAKDTVTIKVVDKIEADAGTDKIIIKGDAIQLVNNTAAGTYLWTPGTFLSDITARQPLAFPTEDIDYILTATSLAGCNTDMDTVHVYVFNDIFIPSAFSPDGNSKNDTWRIPALSAFPNFELFVYNRAGKIVYQCRNVFAAWDGYYKGTPLDPGNYVYLIRLNDTRKRLLKGNLMIIR